MNLDNDQVDKVELTFETENGDTVHGFLGETLDDSGIFEGSIDTRLFLVEYDGRRQDNVLEVAGGEHIRAIYVDQAQQYGERNHEVTAELPVGVPVFTMALKK